MRYARFTNLLLVLTVGASPLLWAQRGGRGAAAAAAQQTATPDAQAATPQTGAAAATPQGATGRAGRGTAGAAAGTEAPNDFYNFNPAAAQVRPDPSVERPPVETHQKISVNGQTLAYTARAGFLPF